MRLIGNLSSQSSEQVYDFCYFLLSQKIPNECETLLSSEGDVASYNIWIKDEDDVERANAFFQQFKQDPGNSRYKGHSQNFTPKENIQLLNDEEDSSGLATNPEGSKLKRMRSPPYGKVTALFLFIVIAVFLWSMFGRTNIPEKLPNLPTGPSVSAIEKDLLYDYPHFFELRDEALAYYSEEDLKNKIAPPPEAQKIIQQMYKTPYWNGIYDRVIFAKHHNKDIDLSGPFFEKVQQGEIWRLWTPILLHFDLLHIFFNVLWFILLGNLIEFKIGSLRYFFLIFTVAIVSNTAQYFMSGPIFMGLSGVVTGLAGFIWARLRVAPWEGYLIHRMTLLFLWIFVFGMFVLQAVFFFLEYYGNFSMLMGIANTAHLVGALVGYLFGRLPFYRVKN